MGARHGGRGRECGTAGAGAEMGARVGRSVARRGIGVVGIARRLWPEFEQTAGQNERMVDFLLLLLLLLLSGWHVVLCF